MTQTDNNYTTHVQTEAYLHTASVGGSRGQPLDHIGTPTSNSGCLQETT